MKEILILRWSGIIISLTSILYGVWILTHPNIITDYNAYQIINEIFNPYFISSSFILSGSLKILGILINSKALLKCSLFAMVFLWLMFGVSFIFVTINNTVWIFALSIALQCVGIAIKEG